MKKRRGSDAKAFRIEPRRRFIRWPRQSQVWRQAALRQGVLDLVPVLALALRRVFLERCCQQQREGWRRCLREWQR